MNQLIQTNTLIGNMKYEITQDKLNLLGANVLDGIYGDLHTEKDNNRYFDINGEGRIHIRKNVPHILFKDYQKMSSQIDVKTNVWAQIIQNWLKEKYGRNIFDEFGWLTYNL
jgi:hypothetical protein